MGSNKSNTNSSMGSAWRVVQNGSNASAYGNDEDDASGMAWVKKRRAEREKTKVAVEQKDQENEEVDPENPPPTIAEEEVQETPRLSKEDNTTPQLPVDVPIVDQTEQPHGVTEHITTAINLPPHRLHKREASFGHRIPVAQVESPTREKPSFGVDVYNMDFGERPEVIPGTPDPSTGGSTSEEEDEDSSRDGDDEDDSDTYSEVFISLLLIRIVRSLTYNVPRRRMRVVRRPWALVSRKSADIRRHLSRRPQICHSSPSKTSYPSPL